MIGAGGAREALAPALPRRHASLHARTRASWPPDADGCDLIVNATPVRDELLVEPHAGQTSSTSPTTRTARDGARRGGARRRLRRESTALEALVRQGAECFELWTGVAAPLG